MEFSSRYWLPFEIVFGALRSLSSGTEEGTEKDGKVLEACQRVLLEGLDFFRTPSSKARELLQASDEGSKISRQKYKIHDAARPAALELSEFLQLDEIQSGILLSRWSQARNVDMAGESLSERQKLELQSFYLSERSLLLSCLHFLIQEGPGQSSGISDVRKNLLEQGLNAKLHKHAVRTLSALGPNNITSWELVAQDIPRAPLPAFSSSSLVGEGEKVKMAQRNSELAAVLDLLILLDHRQESTSTSEQRLELLKSLLPLLCGPTDTLKQTAEPAYQGLIILLQMLNLPDVCLLAGTGNSTNKDLEQLLSSKLNQQVSAELTNWIDVARSVDSLYGILCLAWAAFNCIASSLPKKSSGMGSDSWAPFANVAWQSNALQTFAGVFQRGRLGDDSIMGQCYRRVLRGVLIACMGCFSLFPSNLPNDKLQDVLQIIKGVYSGDEELCKEFWQKSGISLPLWNFLESSRELFPGYPQPLLEFLASLCCGSESASQVLNILQSQKWVTLRHTSNDSAIQLSTDGDVAQALSPISVCRTRLAIPQGAKGQIQSPPKAAGQPESEMIDEELLVRWQTSLSSGLDFLLVFLDSRRTSLSKLTGIPGREKDQHDILAEVRWVARLFCSLSKADPAVFVFEALTSQHATGIDIVPLLAILIDALCHLAILDQILADCFEILEVMASGLPCHVADELSRCQIFQQASQSSDWGMQSNNSNSVDLSQPRLPHLQSLTLHVETRQQKYTASVAILRLAKRLLDSLIHHPLLQDLVSHMLGFVLPRHRRWTYQSTTQRCELTAAAINVLDAACQCQPPASQHHADLQASLMSTFSQPGLCKGCLLENLPPTAAELRAIPGGLDAFQPAVESWLRFIVHLFQTDPPQIMTEAFITASAGSRWTPVSILASYVTFSDWSEPEQGNLALQALAAVIASHSGAQTALHEDLVGDGGFVSALLQPLQDVSASLHRDQEACCQVIQSLLASPHGDLAAQLFAPDSPEPGPVSGAAPNSAAIVPKQSEAPPNRLSSILWGILQTSDEINSRSLRLILKLLETIWQADAGVGYATMQHLKKHTGVFEALTNVITEESEDPAAVQARSAALRILALEAYRGGQSAQESKLWQSLTAWSREANGKYVVKIFDQCSSDLADNSAFDVQKQTVRSILQIACRLLYAPPLDFSYDQQSSLLGRLRIALQPVATSFDSMQDFVAICASLEEKLKAEETPKDNSKEAQLLAAVTKQEVSGILLEYAKGKGSSHFCQLTHVVAHQLGAALGTLAAAIPAFPLLQKALLQLDENVQSRQARGEVLTALQMFATVSSLEADLKCIEAALGCLSQSIKAVEIQQNPSLDSLQLIPADNRATLKAISATIKILISWMKPSQHSPTVIAGPSMKIVRILRNWLQRYSTQSGEQIWENDSVQSATDDLLLLCLRGLQCVFFGEGELQRIDPQLEAELGQLMPVLCGHLNQSDQNMSGCLAILTLIISQQQTGLERNLVLQNLLLAPMLYKVYGNLARDISEISTIVEGSRTGKLGVAATGETCLLALDLLTVLLNPVTESTQGCWKDISAATGTVTGWLLSHLSGPQSEDIPGNGERNAELNASLQRQWIAVLSLWSNLLSGATLHHNQGIVCSLVMAIHSRFYAHLQTVMSTDQINATSMDIQEIERTVFLISLLHRCPSSRQPLPVEMQTSLLQIMKQCLQWSRESIPALRTSSKSVEASGRLSGSLSTVSEKEGSPREKTADLEAAAIRVMAHTIRFMQHNVPPASEIWDDEANYQALSKDLLSKVTNQSKQSHPQSFAYD